MREPFVANWHLKGAEARIVSAIVTPIEDKLALVYIDDHVKASIVPATEHRYLIRLDSQPVERSKASMRAAATNLGCEPEVWEYIGNDDAHEHEAGGETSEHPPADVEKLAGDGERPGVSARGQGDPLPGAGRGPVGESEPQCFDDLIGEVTEEEDIFS